MDDHLAQFIILVGDVCQGASLAGLEVEVLTEDRVITRGLPASVKNTSGEDEVDSSGYARRFRVDGRMINFDDIVACTLHAPPDPGGSAGGS